MAASDAESRINGGENAKIYVDGGGLGANQKLHLTTRINLIVEAQVYIHVYEVPCFFSF